MANMSVMLSIFSSSSREVEIFRVLAPGLLSGRRIKLGRKVDAAVNEHSRSFTMPGEGPYYRSLMLIDS